MNMPTRVYIGMGSNLGDSLGHVASAIKELSALENSTLRSVSQLYRSKPIGPQDQPDYINGVAQLDTHLEPHTLLDCLQQIEHAHQRVRSERWGPRTLDLDILLYGDENIQSTRLMVPHPYMKERPFVLLPLHDLNPELQLPDGTSVADLVQGISAEDIVLLPNYPTTFY